MVNVGRRRYMVGLVFAAAAPLVAVSAAWACQAVTTLQVNPQQGVAGSQVTVTGSNYAAPTGNDPNPSPVYIHLDSRDSAPIAQAAPARNISVTFTIPAGVAIGYHTLIATQYTTSGAPKSGTPGRASFKVVPAAAASTQSAGAASSAEDPAPSGAAPAAAPTQGSTAPTASPTASPTAARTAPAAAAKSAARQSATARVAPPVAASPALAQDASVSQAVPTPSPASDSRVVAPPSSAATDAPPAIRQPALVPAASDALEPSLAARLIVGISLALALLGLLAGVKSGRLLFSGSRQLRIAA